MATTADLIRTAAASVASGKEVTSDTVDPSSSSEGISPASSPEDSMESVRAEQSTVDEFLSEEGGDTPKDSEEPKEAVAAAPKEATPQTSQKEVITVTDETGKRRKVEIDWSNKEQIKKELSLSYGARKWQAERDQALKRAKEIEQKHQEVSTNWNTLEQAFQQQGVEGLVDLLEGRKGAYRETIKKQMEREKFLSEASPEEIRALQAQELAEQHRRENERIRKENEEFKRQITEEREQAEMRSLESRVHPAFHKYRFADKLGNEVQEHMLDEMLWNNTLKRLEPYEEQGIDLTPELIEKEFATAATTIRQLIGKQAEKKAARVVEQKKKEATENVQAKVMSGYKEGGIAQEARNLINSGDTRGLLKNWSKYGGLFNKKK